MVGSNDQRDAQETLMGGSAASFRFTKLGVGQWGSRRYLITAVDGDPCKEPEKVLLLIQLIGSGRGSSHANLPYQLSATKNQTFFLPFCFKGTSGRISLTIGRFLFSSSSTSLLNRMTRDLHLCQHSLLRQSCCWLETCHNKPSFGSLSGNMTTC